MFPSEVALGEAVLDPEAEEPDPVCEGAGDVVTFVEVVRLVADLVVTVKLRYDGGMEVVLIGPPGLGVTAIGVDRTAKVETMVWETEWLPVPWEYPGVEVSSTIEVGRLEMKRPEVGRGEG